MVHWDIDFYGSDGVVLDAPGRVEGCNFSQNVLGGIEVVSGSVILNNTCDRNGTGGNGNKASGSGNLGRQRPWLELTSGAEG